MASTANVVKWRMDYNEQNSASTIQTDVFKRNAVTLASRSIGASLTGFAGWFMSGITLLDYPGLSTAISYNATIGAGSIGTQYIQLEEIQG